MADEINKRRALTVGARTLTLTLTLTVTLTLAASGCTSSGSSSAPTSVPISASDPGWIIYRFAHEGKQGLSMVRPDGTDDHPFLHGDAKAPHHPDWSKDGLAYTWALDQSDGTTDIWVADAKGKHRHKLVDCRKPCQVADEPVWSPDGTQIAYWTRGEGQPPIIRVVDATTGAIKTSIPAPSELDGPITPRWAPDGRRLAVESDRFEIKSGTRQLVDSAIGVIDLTASSPSIHLITAPGTMAAYPDWSPSGDLIVFQAGNLAPFSFAGPPTNLFTIRPDGTELTQLTSRVAGQPYIATPTWAPDGQTILVTLIRDAGEGPGGINRTLAAMSADGNLLLDKLDTLGNPIRGFAPRMFAHATP